MIVFLFSCLTWAQENTASREASERARQISQDASARANEISRDASVRANTVQYYPPAYYGGGGYGWGYQPQPVYQVSQEGAVAIGERVTPPGDILETGVSCVERLAEKLGSKDAQKFCKEVTNKTLGTSGDISRSARKAVKPPLILIPRWGW